MKTGMVRHGAPAQTPGTWTATGSMNTRGKELFSTRTRRVVGEFALEASDQVRNCFRIYRRTCSKFHVRP
jgi:hypothetical protein